MKNVLLLIFSFFIATNAFAHGSLQISAAVNKSVISSDTVVYNLSNAKMHAHNCEWAERCTKNCVFLPKNDLDNKMFYVPCLVCGGGVFEENED